VIDVIFLYFYSITLTMLRKFLRQDFFFKIENWH